MKRKTPHFNLSSIAAGTLAFLLLTLFVVASTAMRPWVKFVRQAQEALVACEQVQSHKCTQTLFAAHKELAHFASNTKILRFIPILNEIPSLLSSHEELLFSVATIQRCLVDCSDTDLSTVVTDAHHSLSSTATALSQSRLWSFVFARSSILASYHQTIQSLYIMSDPLQPLFPHVSELLGQNKPITYRILLQNNKEIRPSGGFMGSYATITLLDASVQTQHVEDIYVPDGQIKGYVQEPFGIKHYLFNGDHPGWRLRDSNWHPDFPTAAQSINWFFAEGQETPADVLVGINLSTVEKIMDTIGSIEVMDYGVTVDSQSIYAITQAQAEHNFFPGSTQKGDFLRALSDAYVQKISSLPLAKKLEVIKLLSSEITRGEIILFAHNPVLQNKLLDLGFAGSLPDIDCHNDWCTPTVLGIVEANVGSTKANCCIVRDFANALTLTDTEITQELTLTYKNSSLEKPEPPFHFGGGYKNYLRLALPKDTVVSTVTIDGEPVTASAIDQEEFRNYRFWGFLHLTQGGETSTVRATLKTPRNGNSSDTRLTLLKQPGIPDVPWNITITNSHGSTNQAISVSKTVEIPLH